MKAASWVLLLGVCIAGCTCDDAPLGKLRFACLSDDECIAGFRCIAGECTRITPLPQPGGDAGCPGTVELCSDGVDNDCDQLSDCADNACLGQACAPFGRQCSAQGTCTCSGNGGQVESEETSCSDLKDNDCDGVVDCQESSCANATCAGFGKTCRMGVCACAADAGVSPLDETACADLQDNDCDGLVDCQEAGCAGQACGPNGRFCSAGVCACSGNGGNAEAAEQSCFDGKDNDCDGMIDCDDPSCKFKRCDAASVASVCCGEGPNALVCKDLENDPLNCGGCGLQCVSGLGCIAKTSGGVRSGGCWCFGDDYCPAISGSSARQDCVENVCACAGGDSAQECPAGATCSSSEAGFCYYRGDGGV